MLKMWLQVTTCDGNIKCCMCTMQAELVCSDYDVLGAHRTCT